MQTDVNMSLGYVNSLLAALPEHVEVELVLKDFLRPQRLLTRDRPASDRRLTSLTSGREWFLPLSENIDIATIKFSVSILVDSEL